MSDKEQYDNVCKAEFAEIKGMIKEMHTALFIGNGTPALKTRVEIHDRYFAVVTWFAGIVITALVALGFKAWEK